MRLMCIALIGLFLCATEASCQVVIKNDNGGRIILYLLRYRLLYDTGQHVRIEGECNSACTLVLGVLPYDRICVTPDAVLGFHAAWEYGGANKADKSVQVINPTDTKTIYNIYPPLIRRWIDSKGGLGRNMIWLKGDELLRMYREC